MGEIATTATAARSAPRGRTFIRVTEVWTPDPETGLLVPSSGIYGGLDAFAAISGKETFAKGEGLPGKAWAEGRPIVLKDFRGSYFKRTEAAEAAGLTAGIAMPVFNGETLMGVVTFLFGDDAAHVGAVEVWAQQGSDLALADGYFGTADYFGWISRHTRFPKGQGLPGTVLATGAPVLFRDLGYSHRFIRFEGAAEAGITMGLGLPVPAPGGSTHVVTLLSALGTPIARQFEIWRRSPERGDYGFAEGMTETGGTLFDGPQPPRFTPGQGLLGQVAETGVPVASADGAATAGVRGLGALVAVPVFRDGKVAEIAVWFF